MIVFVHLGEAPLPACLHDAVAIARRIAPASQVTVLAAERHGETLTRLGAAFVAVESLPVADELARFQERFAFNSAFRDGFWLQASARFFALGAYMRASGAEDVLHLENDVALYFDPAARLDAFRGFAEFAVPLDRTRAIPGVVWLANARAAGRLTGHMLANAGINDMDSLGRFCLANGDIARPLPTLPAAWAAAKGLDAGRYCQGIERFGGVFDAAAIGQYVGGVHWLNNPHDSRFFKNESSDLDLDEFDLCWDVAGGARTLVLARDGERTPVLAIHAHSKDLAGVSPFNHGVPQDEATVITGERLQAIADLTVSTPAITAFHGRERIRSRDLVEVAQNAAGQLLVPDAALIEKCRAARVIFVYTHLMLYFIRYIAPRLTEPFTVVAHNSDHAVGLGELELLNHPRLLRCWAQNVSLAHSRLAALPIGMANVQWGAERVEEVVAAGRRMEKSRLLYVNINPTHPSRARALQAGTAVAGATLESKVDFATYVRSMAGHKFCLCPRGNGLDSHRFWEAQYLDVIPVIVREDWAAAYSGLPLLLLDSWEDLPRLDLRREYIRIRSTAFRHEGLTLGHFREAIAQGGAG